MNIPQSARIVSDARDYLILEFDLPLKTRLASRVGVLWDIDRDRRVLDVLAAIRFRDLRTASHVLAIHEFGGKLTVWLGGIDIATAQERLQSAADAALRPHDRWPVTVRPVATCDQLLDRSQLAEDHPLRAIPEKFQLGVVQL